MAKEKLELRSSDTPEQNPKRFDAAGRVRAGVSALLLALAAPGCNDNTRGFDDCASDPNCVSGDAGTLVGGRSDGSSGSDGDGSLSDADHTADAGAPDFSIPPDSGVIEPEKPNDDVLPARLYVDAVQIPGTSSIALLARAEGENPNAIVAFDPTNSDLKWQLDIPHSPNLQMTAANLGLVSVDAAPSFNGDLKLTVVTPDGEGVQTGLQVRADDEIFGPDSPNIKCQRDNPGAETDTCLVTFDEDPFEGSFGAMEVEVRSDGSVRVLRRTSFPNANLATFNTPQPFYLDGKPGVVYFSEPVEGGPYDVVVGLDLFGANNVVTLPQEHLAFPFDGIDSDVVAPCGNKESEKDLVCFTWGDTSFGESPMPAENPIDLIRLLAVNGAGDVIVDGFVADNSGRYWSVDASEARARIASNNGVIVYTGTDGEKDYSLSVEFDQNTGVANEPVSFGLAGGVDFEEETITRTAHPIVADFNNGIFMLWQTETEPCEVREDPFRGRHCDLIGNIDGRNPVRTVGWSVSED